MYYNMFSQVYVSDHTHTFRMARPVLSQKLEQVNISASGKAPLMPVPVFNLSCWVKIDLNILHTQYSNLFLSLENFMSLYLALHHFRKRLHMLWGFTPSGLVRSCPVPMGNGLESYEIIYQWG